MGQTSEYKLSFIGVALLYSSNSIEQIKCTNADVEDKMFGFILKHRSFSKWRRRWRMRSNDNANK